MMPYFVLSAHAMTDVCTLLCMENWTKLNMPNGKQIALYRSAYVDHAATGSLAATMAVRSITRWE